MNKTSAKTIKRTVRHRRVRSKVFGTSERPRLSVFRSNSNIYAQLIDDDKGNTLASASYKEVKGKTKVEVASEVGKLIAEKAKKAGVESVVFDRGGFNFTGRVKALADGAREGGLKF